MTTTAIKTEYTIKVTMIEFDFLGYDWEEDEYTEAEWEKLMADTTKEWTNKSFVLEVDADDLNDPDEDFLDEILPRRITSYISDESGWCINDIDYKVS